MGLQNPATTVSEEHPHASTNWEHHGTGPKAKAWHWLLEGHRLPSSSLPTGPQTCRTAGKEPEAPSASCPSSSPQAPKVSAVAGSRVHPVPPVLQKGPGCLVCLR